MSLQLENYLHNFLYIFVSKWPPAFDSKLALQLSESECVSNPAGFVVSLVKQWTTESFRKYFTIYIFDANMLIYQVSPHWDI